MSAVENCREICQSVVENCQSVVDINPDFCPLNMLKITNFVSQLWKIIEKTVKKSLINIEDFVNRSLKNNCFFALVVDKYHKFRSSLT